MLISLCLSELTASYLLDAFSTSGYRRMNQISLCHSCNKSHFFHLPMPKSQTMVTLKCRAIMWYIMDLWLSLVLYLPTCVQQDYKLVITGHSLGAGVASILAVLLRPQFPDLVCYAFSPPGCIFRCVVSDICSRPQFPDLTCRSAMPSHPLDAYSGAC